MRALNPKSVLALLAVLLLAGFGLLAVLGTDRGQRAAQVRVGAPANLLQPAELAPSEPDAQRSEARRTAPETRAEIVPEAAQSAGEPGWWGRAIDGETEEPLAGASFAVVREKLAGDELFARVESDGAFVAPIATWNEEVVSVRAPGYATAYAVASGAHRARRDPQRVLLWRAATLVLRVTGAEAPLVTVTVPDHEFLQAEGATFVTWEPFLWASEARGDGSLVFTDLPARVRLNVEIGPGAQVQMRRTLTLEPAETLELHWPVGGELTLAGRALDPEDRPVQELELWILANDLPHRNLTLADERRAFAITRTGSDGSFSFSGLVPGRYHVGPAPRGTFFVPLATTFTLHAGEEQVTLTCWRGVEIRGRVRATEGASLAKATVTASAQGLLFSTTTKDDGSFVLGPLATGPYELVARQEDRASAPVLVQGGDAGIELLLPGAEEEPQQGPPR